MPARRRGRSRTASWPRRYWRHEGSGEPARGGRAVPRHLDREGPGPRAEDATPGDRHAAERARRGRPRRDEKVTFYCTADELMDLENARLLLRREHGVAVDRGRIVREALAQVLSELERDGAEAPLVKRLTR